MCFTKSNNTVHTKRCNHAERHLAASGSMTMCTDHVHTHSAPPPLPPLNTSEGRLVAEVLVARGRPVGQCHGLVVSAAVKVEVHEEAKYMGSGDD